VPEHVGGDAHLGVAAEETVDLLAPRGERHRAVEDRDLAGTDAVHLPCQSEDGPAAERDDDRADRQRPQRAGADELERKLALEQPHLRLWEGALDQRQRVDGAEQEDVAVLGAEQQAGPGGAALGVVCPLHLVEHEHLALARRHLDGAADDRCVLVHTLLPGDQADAVGSELGAQAAVRLLRQHPQRPGVDAASLLGEKPQRVVRLAGVRRAEVGDDALGFDPPFGQADLDPALRAAGGGALTGAAAATTLGAAGPLAPRASVSPSGHRATVAAACVRSARGDEVRPADRASARGRAAGSFRARARSCLRRQGPQQCLPGYRR
jgi:hypothetical protein